MNYILLSHVPMVRRYSEMLCFVYSLGSAQESSCVWRRQSYKELNSLIYCLHIAAGAPLTPPLRSPFSVGDPMLDSPTVFGYFPAIVLNCVVAIPKIIDCVCAWI